MFEFTWHVPGPTPSEVVLRIHSHSGWLGRKVLTCDGRRIYRRGALGGVEARFRAPGGGSALHLRFARVPHSDDWRPLLFADGVELPESTGHAPPRIVPPPKSLMVPVGFTYLVMAIAVAMLPNTSTILDAFHVRRDDRKVVLTVVEPNAPSNTLAVEVAQSAPAVAGQPYSTPLRPVGGQPPYTWSPVRDGWPRGWTLAATTGELTGTPPDAHDLFVRVKLRDASGASVERPIPVVVQAPASHGADWPVITTQVLPPATVGQPYEFTVARTGGKPPLDWKTVGKRRLPDGLRLDGESGVIRGTPREAGAFPVTLRVMDDYYESSRDIARWIAPFVVTAVCLLGFLDMRRWSVYVFAALIALQAVGALGLRWPISTTALGVQVVLWLVGLAHVARMR